MENPLKEKRLSMGLTINQMSDSSGFNTRKLYSWESDQNYPNMKLILRVARAYSMSNEEIIKWLEYVEEITK